MERYEIHNRITELMFGTTAPTGQIWTAIHEIEHDDAARISQLEAQLARRPDGMDAGSIIDEQAARISQLEAQLREREAECERLDEARIELKNLVQQWENWLSDLQADFVGLTAEKNQLHEWEWIEEHRCWPPCICEES